MANITAPKTEVKSLKTCMLGFVAATGLGLIAIPAHANQASVNNSNSVNQSIHQSNIQRSDGKSAGSKISIQNAENNATVSGENNHIGQDIRQLNDAQGSDGEAEDDLSIQNAVNNAAVSGRNNRIKQEIDQSILWRNFKH